MKRATRVIIGSVLLMSALVITIGAQIYAFCKDPDISVYQFSIRYWWVICYSLFACIVSIWLSGK